MTTQFERPTVTVLGRDPVGLIAVSEGMRYYLTECCLASAKGMQNFVGCRGCYQPIDEALGGLPPQSGSVQQSFGDGVPYDTFRAIKHAEFVAYLDGEGV